MAQDEEFPHRITAFQVANIDVHISGPVFEGRWNDQNVHYKQMQRGVSVTNVWLFENHCIFKPMRPVSFLNQ